MFWLQETCEGQDEHGDDSQSTPTTSLSSMTPMPPPQKRKKSMGPIAKQNELLQLACNYLSADSNISTQEPEDEYLNIAKVWANKLKDLCPTQRKFAEKAINDILFEAGMGSLHRGSVQINIQNSLVSPSTTSAYSSAGLSPSGMSDSTANNYKQHYTEPAEDLDADVATYFSTFGSL